MNIYNFKKNAFFDFLNSLKPNEYEINKNPKRKATANYMAYNRERFYLAIYFFLKYAATKNPVICDFGTYPGSIIHILNSLLQSSDLKPVFYGTGIAMDSKFIECMKHNFSAELFVTNFDPENTDLKRKNYPSKVPLEENSIDAIFATEIIEHLTNPLILLNEAFRLLKPGGVLILTTPNVTRIGSVLKLATGETNLDYLMPAGYSNPDDEWRPHFREYSMSELRSLFTQSGFSIQETMFFNYNFNHYNLLNLKHKFMNLAKLPFYIVPHFREGNIVIGRKDHK